MSELPLLVYLVTEDWAFCSHRLPTALAARAAGYRVAVMARANAHAETIRGMGYDFIPLSWQRRSLNPLAALRDILNIAAQYRRLRPALTHHVALKPILMGGLAARLAGVPQQIAALTGVGFVFSDTGWIARLLRLGFVPLLRWVLLWPGVLVWFQNPDDRDLFLRLGLVKPEQIHLLPGSGVDTHRLQPLPEPQGVVTCAYAGRMLHSKGVDVLVAAQQRCRRDGVMLDLCLAGSTDDNPTSFSDDQLRAWAALPGVHVLGHVADIRDLWARAHIAVLPCRVREGVPKTLLDAAACGRPLVASDVEGVRVVACHNQTALVTPPGDTDALAAALMRLVGDAALRQRLGHNARAHVAATMSADAIGQQAEIIYRQTRASARTL